MRKVLLFTLLAWAGMALAGACAGTGSPPAQLAFTFDRSGNRDSYTSDVRGLNLTILTASLPYLVARGHPRRLLSVEQSPA